MFSNTFLQWRQSVVVCSVLAAVLHSSTDVLGDVIEIGSPQWMCDFPTIPNRHLYYMDVTRDGSRVALSTHGTCGEDRIYVCQPDCQACVPVIPPQSRGVGEVSFSLDGTTLFFSWDDETGTGWDIWRVNGDGSGNATRLLGAFRASDDQVFPCPVVVNGQHRLVYRERWSASQIYLRSADMSGGDVTDLTSNGERTNAPQASPDGSKIVYHSQNYSGTKCADIFLMEFDGAGDPLITPITEDETVTEEGYPILARNHLGEEVIVYERKNPSTELIEMWATDLTGAAHQLLIASADNHISQYSYAPDDPISPHGAIYYLATPGACQTSELWRVAVIPEPATVSLDVKPGSCPNPLNRNSHGVLPVALVGTGHFDVTTVDVSSVRLSRADGVGGEVAPNEGPPGPHSEFEDVATPFMGERCECHYLAGDGIVDLSMKFRTDDVVDILELNDLGMGDEVELIITGLLTDGTEFTSAGDCILIVPRGVSNLIVTSSVPELFVGVTPANLCNVDDSGFADFQRDYTSGTTVTLTAPEILNDLVLSGWEVDGTSVPSVSGTTSVTLMEAYTTAEAVYVPASRAPAPAPTPTPVPRPVPRPVIR